MERTPKASAAAVNPPTKAPDPVPAMSFFAFRGWTAPLLLIALVFGVYFQTIGHGFFTGDDDKNIYANPHVRAGLTPEGIAWAFTHFAVNRWAPLAVLCSQFNCTIFGLWPGGHHLVNMLLYAAGVVVLFYALAEMTGLWNRGFVVAAIFALHPLHVESVAWASGRNDVLCGLFSSLMLLFYAKQARHPRWLWYSLTIIAYACGLLSKPAILTLPVGLLILDAWPLHRLNSWRDLGVRLWEKAPLFILATGAGILNLLGNERPVEPWPALPLLERVGNSCIAYIFYLDHIFLPRGLGSYPFAENGAPAWQTIGALALLLLISAVVYFLREGRPWLVAGWLWYGILLAPMVGLFSVVGQLFADRYPYLAQLGIEWAVVWTVAEAASAWPQAWRKPLLPALSSLTLAALFAGSWIQTTYWADNMTFWRHCLDSYPDSATARITYGMLLARGGDNDGAIREYQRVLEAHPNYADGELLLGTALMQERRLPEAVEHLQKAIRLRPYDGLAYMHLGSILFATHHPNEGLAAFRAALKNDPGAEGLRESLIYLLTTTGKTSAEAQRLLDGP
jgi:tetratricopeptide (TPR) repeat protein